MNLYFITGTSKGLGKALAEVLLENKENKVIGLSRHCTIGHPRYQHLTVDLSDMGETKAINFRLYEVNSTGKVVLINNAGVIHPVKYMGNASNDSIIDHFHINLMAPAILCNNFLHAFGKEYFEKMIVNISSGAGKYPVDGWGCYCPAKAGLDMFSKVVDLENKYTERNCKVFSIAPGIVDTTMQDEIRNTHKEDFSRLDEFMDYKKNKMLAAPRKVAEKYKDIVESPEQYEEVLLRIN